MAQCPQRQTENRDCESLAQSGGGHFAQPREQRLPFEWGGLGPHVGAAFKFECVGRSDSQETWSEPNRPQGPASICL